MRHWLSCLLLVLLLPVPALAADDGMSLLRQASEAYRTEQFRGRLVYARGNRTDTMQLVHASFDGVEHERLSHLDNSSAEIIRRGNEVTCVHPDARVTRLGAAGAGVPFRPFVALDDGIPDVYAVSAAGQSRRAGRTVDLLQIVAADTHRYGYRLWIDRQTRLPLRYEIVNRRGQPLESAEFVELEIGIDVPRDLFAVPSRPDGRVLTITASAEAAMPPVAPSWLPPGFRVTGSELQRFGNDPTPVSAVTYSDGLAAFSFFVEPAAPNARPMGRQIGPTIAVSGILDAGASGRFLVTLVGELPARTAVRIVEGARYQGDGRKGPAGEARRDRHD